MPQTVLIAVGGGALSALLTLFALSGIPGGALLAYMAPLPLLMVGLGLGAGAAPLAAATGVAVVGAFGGLAAAGIYGGLHAFPSWFVARQALIRTPTAAGATAGWYPPGEILCRLAVLAAIAVAVGSLLTPEGIEQSLRQMLEQAFDTAAPTLNDVQRSALVDQIAPLFLGGMGVMWIIMIAVNGAGAQGLLAGKRWNLRPSPRWSAVTLPDWFSWALVATAVIALFAGGELRYIARNTVLILGAPYFFVGLAVVHGLAHRTPATRFVLVGYYLTLGFAFPAMSAATAVLGVIEQWIGVRRRFAVVPPANNSND